MYIWLLQSQTKLLSCWCIYLSVLKGMFGFGCAVCVLVSEHLLKQKGSQESVCFWSGDLDFYLVEFSDLTPEMDFFSPNLTPLTEQLGLFLGVFRQGTVEFTRVWEVSWSWSVCEISWRRELTVGFIGPCLCFWLWHSYWQSGVLCTPGLTEHRVRLYGY